MISTFIGVLREFEEQLETFFKSKGKKFLALVSKDKVDADFTEGKVASQRHVLDQSKECIAEQHFPNEMDEDKMGSNLHTHKSSRKMQNKE